MKSSLNTAGETCGTSVSVCVARHTSALTCRRNTQSAVRNCLSKFRETMEELNTNRSSGDQEDMEFYNDQFYNGPNDDEEKEKREFIRKLDFAVPLFVRITATIEIPIMILTLFALCVLIKSHRSPPVFVIHLILSDLIQIICRLMNTIEWSWDVHKAYYYSLVVGVYFMACVAFERYLLVSHPIWYKSHHSPKVCCVISVIIWFIPLIFANIGFFLFDNLPLLIACLIPYPIIILCFVGTYRGLSRAISLTPLKRKKILGSLFLVLLTYSFLILPYLIVIFIGAMFENFYKSLLYLKLFYFFEYLMFLNPLADCVLYMFLRPDVGGVMKSALCCCRTDTHQNSTHSRDTHSRDSSAAFPCCVSLQKPASHSQTACSSV